HPEAILPGAGGGVPADASRRTGRPACGAVHRAGSAGACLARDRARHAAQPPARGAGGRAARPGSRAAGPRSLMPTVRWHPLALVSLALTAWVYARIVGVFFFADDFYHLAQIADGRGIAYVMMPFAGHNLVVRNLVFIAMWRLFGLHSELW